MKTALAVMMWLALLCGAHAADDAKKEPLAISIVVPVVNDAEKTWYHSNSGRNIYSFRVLVENTSDTPQSICRESCSWGWSALSFELTDPKGKKFTATRKLKEWTRNFPECWVLQPHEFLVLDVNLGDDTWEGSPDVWDNYGGSPLFTLRAIFAIASDDAFKSEKQPPWTGRVESAEEKIHLIP